MTTNCLKFELDPKAAPWADHNCPPHPPFPIDYKEHRPKAIRAQKYVNKQNLGSIFLLY